MRINDLGNTATDFASDDYIAIDGTTNGSRKLKHNSLKNVIAQHVIATDVVEEYDPTRDSAHPYSYGDIASKDGKIYFFKTSHYGAWDSSVVFEISLQSYIVKCSATKNKIVNDGTTQQYINPDGSLTISASWNCYKFIVDSGSVFYRGWNSVSGNLAVAFYDSETPSAASCIGKVEYEETGIWQSGSLAIPSGTKCVLVSSRTADGRTDNEADVGANIENIEKFVKSTNERFDSIELSLNINDAISVDAFYYSGSDFVASPAWKRFTFDCFENYFKIKVKAATNTASFGEVVYLDSSKAVLSYETFGSSGVASKTLQPPSGCRYICLCNRTADLANPEFFAYSENMRESFMPVMKAKITDVESMVNDVNERFLSLSLDSALFTDNIYYNGTNPTFSTSWDRYVFVNNGFSKIKVKAATNTASFSEIVFCSNENLDIISNITFGSTGTIEKEVSVPTGCKYIVICNRNASLANPEFYAFSADLQNVFTTIKNTGVNFAGSIKFKAPNVSNRVVYKIQVGNIEEIAKHFKMALVKDGVVKYFVNGTNILKDENGFFDSVLDGTDGDLLIVNDVPIYFITGYAGDAAVRLFSLVPFEYGGVQARKIETRGEAPSLCFVDNINDSNYNDHETNLGTGKSHYTRNSSNVAYFAPMSGIVGKYVPTEIGGVISYSYDSSKAFVESGTFRPSVWLNQNTAERAATNKDANGAEYTNLDLLSLEIVLALAETECGTNYINNFTLFGNGFASPVHDGVSLNEAVFTNGTNAINGVRFKDSSDNWVYAKLNAKPFNNDKYLFEMLTDWNTPWEIMEQHLALSYAKENSIDVNTWFVFNGNEYKYLNVGTLKGIADGVMTAVLFKKFRSKIDSGITYNGVSVAGNDIEFVIISSVYRGWILDVSPHRWVTGLNVTIDDSNKYRFFATFNHKKYIMDQDYTEIDESAVYDFEKQYNFVTEITDSATSIFFSKYTKENSVYLMTEGGATLNSYECGVVETDKKKANAGKKVVTGVKLGYGAFSEQISRNFLFLYHSRTYVVAKAGYSSFVCQNVKV